jgi:hypothetical protein
MWFVSPWMQVGCGFAFIRYSIKAHFKNLSFIAPSDKLDWPCIQATVLLGQLGTASFIGCGLDDIMFHCEELVPPLPLQSTQLTLCLERLLKHHVLSCRH